MTSDNQADSLISPSDRALYGDFTANALESLLQKQADERQQLESKWTRLQDSTPTDPSAFDAIIAANDVQDPSFPGPQEMELMHLRRRGVLATAHFDAFRGSGFWQSEARAAARNLVMELSQQIAVHPCAARAQSNAA